MVRTRGRWSFRDIRERSAQPATSTPNPNTTAAALEVRPLLIESFVIESLLMSGEYTRRESTRRHSSIGAQKRNDFDTKKIRYRPFMGWAWLTKLPFVMRQHLAQSREGSGCVGATQSSLPRNTHSP